MWRLVYSDCAANLKKLGTKFGRTLRNILIDRFGQNLSDIHVIGHSLGGHLAGFIAREMAKDGEKVFRLTG